MGDPGSCLFAFLFRLLEYCADSAHVLRRLLNALNPNRAAALLARVGLGDRLDHYPVQLSGGEQQRVALARAFVHRPLILFADEPTGNLDQDTGGSIVAILEELNRESDTTLVLVTHDLALAERAHRVIRLSDGRVISDRPAAGSQAEGAAARGGGRVAAEGAQT